MDINTFNKLTTCFRDISSVPGKYEKLPFIILLLSSAKESYNDYHKGKNDRSLLMNASKNIWIGIADIILKTDKQRIPEFRKMLLQLIHQLISIKKCGFSILFDPNTFDNKSFYKNIGPLVIKLVSIEIKMMLDEAETVFIDGEQMNNENKNRKEEEKDRNSKVNYIMNLIPLCFGIIESLIIFLTEDEPIIETFNIETIENLRSSLHEIVLLLLQFIDTIQDYKKTFVYLKLKDEMKDKSFQLDILVAASLRLLFAWMADDCDVFVNKIVKILPFVLDFASNFVQDTTYQNLDSEESITSEDNENLLDLMIPGIYQLSISSHEAANIINQHIEIKEKINEFYLA